MNRISRHSMFMSIAEVASRRSTCFRRNVGAVIVANKNIISIGYNGPPSGEPHCTGNGCAGPSGACTRAVHAEVNALSRASGGGQWTWSMYCTESPCPACARVIVNSRVAEVFYLNQYRLIEGIETLILGGVVVWRMTPSGYIINFNSGELVDLS